MRRKLTAAMAMLAVLLSASLASAELADTGLANTELAGDANGDGVVDGLDYDIWKDHLGEKTTLGAAVGDFNHDGHVTGRDYLLWAGNVVVPEPEPEAGYWVAAAGNDNDDGSSQRPFRTIQRAADVARAGDTVYVGNGSFAGWHTVNSGSPDEPIIFAGTGETEIVGGDYGVRVSGEDEIRIAGFVIHDHAKEGVFANNANGLVLIECTIYRNGLRRKWDHGVALDGCRDFALADIHSYENHAMGVYSKDCDGGVMTRVVANNNRGTSGSDGILLQNSSMIALDHCQAHNNGEDGIDFGGFEDSSHPMSNVIARNCTANNNGGEGYAISGAHDGEFQSFGFVLEDCVALGNNGEGVQIYVYTRDVTLRRCTLSDNRRPWNIHTGARDILFDDCTWNGTGYPNGADAGINFRIEN